MLSRFSAALQREAQRTTDLPCPSDQPADPAATGLACAATAHRLWHGGAGPERWQPWLALGAWANALGGQIWFAHSLSLLAQVHPHVALLMPRTAPWPARCDQQALGALLGLYERFPAAPDPQRLANVAEGYDSLYDSDHCGVLAQAIPAGDWERTAESLNALAELAAPGFSDWHPELRPGYEPASAALAALALARGLPPARLNAAARRWYWPAVESRPELGLRVLRDV